MFSAPHNDREKNGEKMKLPCFDFDIYLCPHWILFSPNMAVTKVGNKIKLTGFLPGFLFLWFLGWNKKFQAFFTVMMAKRKTYEEFDKRLC